MYQKITNHISGVAEQNDYFVEVTDVQIKKPNTPAIRTLSVKAPVRPARNHIHGMVYMLHAPTTLTLEIRSKSALSKSFLKKANTDSQN